MVQNASFNHFRGPELVPEKAFSNTTVGSIQVGNPASWPAFSRLATSNMHSYCSLRVGLLWGPRLLLLLLLYYYYTTSTTTATTTTATTATTTSTSTSTSTGSYSHATIRLYARTPTRPFALIYAQARIIHAFACMPVMPPLHSSRTPVLLFLPPCQFWNCLDYLRNIP